MLLAQVHVARGEDGKAVELLRSAIGDQPGMAAAQNDLAFLLARRGESLPEATELAQEARANRPDSPQIADTLGWILHRQGDDQGALELLRPAAEGSPDNAEIQYHLGFVLHAVGDSSAARESLRSAIRKDPESSMADEARALVDSLR